MRRIPIQFTASRLRPNAPRPIGMGESLWAEELTFMEVRDKIRAGTTTIIIGTGGIEQNGPYVSGGKHNYVLQTVLPYIARDWRCTHCTHRQDRARGLRPQL